MKTQLPIRHSLALVMLAGLTLFSNPAHAAAPDAARGLQLYQARCAACHSVEYNGVGPAHKNVFGRKAGSLADYAYSSALKSSGLNWDQKNLERWLTNPEKLVPGQKMGYSVASAKDRADLIAYLKTISNINP